MDFIESKSDFLTRLNDDGTGITEVPTEVLARVIARADEFNLDMETLANIKKDVFWARAHYEECIQYYCY
jgi:hypothetical protein